MKTFLQYLHTSLVGLVCTRVTWRLIVPLCLENFPHSVHFVTLPFDGSTSSTRYSKRSAMEQRLCEYMTVFFSYSLTTSTGFVIPNSSCLQNLSYPNGKKIGHQRRPYFQVYSVKASIFSNHLFIHWTRWWTSMIIARWRCKQHFRQTFSGTNMLV